MKTPEKPNGSSKNKKHWHKLLLISMYTKLSYFYKTDGWVRGIVLELLNESSGSYSEISEV